MGKQKRIQKERLAVEAKVKILHAEAAKKEAKKLKALKKKNLNRTEVHMIF
jgi:hypothetical protein